MHITTIEDGFQYRMHFILKSFKKEYDEAVKENNGKTLISFEDWLWNIAKDFGQKVIEDIDSYCGLDEALNNKY